MSQAGMACNPLAGRPIVAGMSSHGSSGAWGHMTGAAGVVDALRRAGVTRVFGIPSVENTWLFDAFQASPIEMVLCTHEQNAAFMADAHARLTGKLAACVLAPGQGLVKALCGVAQARMDSSPVVVLVAGGRFNPTVDRRRLEPRYDQLALAKPVAKRVFRIEEPEMVPSAMARAVQLAWKGEPGPVVVEIPMDVQQGRARMEGTGFRPGPRVLSAEAERALEQAVALMQTARQVGIYAGAGCFQALVELEELAEKLDAPVATSLSGLGALPAIHPLSVGFGPGPAGSPIASEAFAACDLVLALGCRFSEAATGGFQLKFDVPLVHVDIEPGVAGLNLPAEVAVTAPAKVAIRYLLDRLEDRQHPNMRERIRLAKRELRQRLDGRPDWTDAVDPIKFYRQLRELMSSEDVLVLDAGHHAYYAFACYPVQAPRTLLAPVDYRASGFAIPAAVAVGLDRPDGRVVACIGDGGFLQTHQELLTARRCNLAPVVVVFADQQLGLVRSFQERVLGRETAVDLVPVDYELLAQALGVRYACIRRDDELVAGLKRALTLEAPVIVELRVAYREAATYLRVAEQLERKRLPRGASLRVGARLILKKILGRR